MNKLKKLIIALFFPVALAGGIGGEYTLNPDIRIDALDKNLTGFEYSQLKTKLADIAITDRLECVNLETNEIYCDVNAKRLNKEEGFMNIAWQNQQLYYEMLDIEIKKCGGKLYKFKNKQDIRDMLKKFEDEGCPK